MRALPGDRSSGRFVAPLVLVVATIGIAPDAAAQSRVTFAKDVAPIIFEHCSSCHRPGEIGPFSLLTYEDVRPRAAAIARAVRTGLMPPWKPEPGYGEFAGARRLSARQIGIIGQWIDGGALEGNPADLPLRPSFPDGWRLGEPDLVIRMAEPYQLPASGPDVLRNFAIPIPLRSTQYVKGLEFRPGNARVVHHADIRIDRTPSSRVLDEADPAPGYDGRLSANSEFPDGHFLGWTPGQLVPFSSDDMSWRLDPGSDLVVQLHLHPTGTPELVQASIGLFFTDTPPARTPTMLRLGRQNIDIAAGVTSYRIDDRYVLPIDVEVHAVQPHAHFRAREIRGWATLPDGTRRWLIYIKNWDFNWQDVYRYSEPFVLPKGTTLAMQYTYDNSATNRSNPDRPPKRVRWGQNSGDEMGDLWIQVLPRTEEDRKRLSADFGPKVMAEDAVGYEKLLESDRQNARLHEAVAALYLSLQETDKALVHLRDALQIDPDSAEAHYNLAIALVRTGQIDDAIQHFERTLQIDPDHVAAHVNLGAVFRSRNRLVEAIAHLRRALELDADNAAAHTNAAGVFAEQGNVRDAIAQYRLAVQAAPDMLESLTGLAWILATSADSSIREPAEATRLAQRAAALTNRQSVRPLEALAAALAAVGQFDEAVATQQAALRLLESARSGSNEAAGLLRTRLELYRQHKPLAF